MPEEVLLASLVVRGSHVVAEKIHLANAEVPCEVYQLMPGVPAIENVMWCLAYSVPAAACNSLQLTLMLCHALRTLRPHLRSAAVKSFRIEFKPLRIAKIKDIQKVTNAISIAKTEYRNLSTLMKRSNVFNIFFAERRTCRQ